MVNTVDANLKRLSTVAGGFFTGLSLLVGSFPHFNEISKAFPYTPRPEDSMKGLATLVTLAVVGGGYLSAKVTAKTRRRTGTLWLLSAVVALLLYDFLWLKEDAAGFIPRFANSNGVLAAIYLAVYGMLARGFLQMSLFAYGVRRGSLPTTEGLPIPIWRKMARWWHKYQTRRALLREENLKRRVRGLERKVEKAEEERLRREGREKQIMARLEKQMRRRTFILWLMIASVLALAAFLVAPVVLEIIEGL